MGELKAQGGLLWLFCMACNPEVRRRSVQEVKIIKKDNQEMKADLQELKEENMELCKGMEYIGRREHTLMAI